MIGRKAHGLARALDVAGLSMALAAYACIALAVVGGSWIGLRFSWGWPGLEAKPPALTSEPSIARPYPRQPAAKSSKRAHCANCLPYGSPGDSFATGAPYMLQARAAERSLQREQEARD